MIDINPPAEDWTIELLDRTAAVTVGHYTQYFTIHQGHAAPCDVFGQLEPVHSFAAHKLPNNVERKVRSLLRTKEKS